MKMSRVATTAGQLARLGFADPAQAVDCVALLGPQADALVHLIAVTADPDLGLRYLADLGQRDPELLPALAADEGTAMRLVSVLGASQALGDHLLRHPEQWHELQSHILGTTRPTAAALRAALLGAVGADPVSATPSSTLPDAEAVDVLRVEYRRHLLRLASRDLGHSMSLGDAAAELSDLAGATLETGLAIARARVGESAASARLAVVAMGKCGGHELNYVSDVDVIFVAEPAAGAEDGPAMRAATQLASHLMRICSDHTAAGTIWPVDAALRPEGKSGPLVRTLASHVGYYERWAKTWEFQALLKARPIAGDVALGEEYVVRLAPLVWSAAERENFVPDVQAMRQRVLDHIPASQADRQLKLGAGGLRDVEFSVQLLQLVHGRTDESLRVQDTLGALAALTKGGYVGRSDGQALDEAYRFLRTMEHRIQLFQLRRTHLVPSDEADLRRIARSMGLMRESVKELDQRWRDYSREVRRLHEKLFYRPLLEAVAKLPTDAARLSPQAAQERMRALGYEDPQAALRHLQALTSGVSRTAAIQRTLLPAMLQWFAEAPNPDQGLLGFRQISEALGSTHWYLRTLRDEGKVAHGMATLLGSSRYATDLLHRAPEGVALLGAPDGLIPLGLTALRNEMDAAASRHQDPVTAVTSIRAIRRRELFRIAAADLLEHLDVTLVGAALTDVTSAALGAAVQVARRQVDDARPEPLAAEFAVISMGRFGGRELGYSSDADVMFVFRPHPGVESSTAAKWAQEIANETRRLLALPGTDPALEVDADLRPEGRQGAMVRSLDSYAAYYDKWSEVWEFQALLRADAVIGDPGLCADFLAMIDPLRFPVDGVSDAGIREVQRIKARVDKERLPRGADPATHLKLGPGGLADIEWTVQLLQMQHAGAHPALRTAQTLTALRAAVEADLLTEADAAELSGAWRLASQIRNAITLVRGKSADSLPRDRHERAAVAHVLGYSAGHTDELVNDYLRATRHARRVVDRVFWGDQ